ncbi:uncharacterized protein MONBRDRAFT_18771 [Monosiga brevicollis MX1]|uniref:Protein kinase domain-containing protein n=1 Tax=Monosiga brevicollis TaxID=81824 RepID=A9UXE1_MONBE|nr:uncharacterized protein MONBRDRAFT_18771 [Monosiga brevicollis MX1]EDQ90375.1 predicted protein [Monosiga brevicollis MX1]|eukprot:XP_001745142.1 hypothetical protein [Monosiga brevicollis MX1]
MAPECVVERRFSEKSDVWSFGVFVWELATRGQVPWGDVDLGPLTRMLKSGRRLELPSHCPALFARIAARCQVLSPSERPTFAELASLCSEPQTTTWAFSREANPIQDETAL